MDEFVPGCLSWFIVSGKQVEPGGVIFENSYWHVGSAVGPIVWRGFLVIKLKRHCEHLAELTPEEAAVLGSVMRNTCLAVNEVLRPAKIYICSIGDGVKHVHFWVLPRPPGMHPGMHSVMFNLDMRWILTRLFGIKKWMIRDEQVRNTAERLRGCFTRLMEKEGL